MAKAAKRKRNKVAGAGAAPDNGVSRFCPRFHHAVELIGRRWSGAIINAMLPGPQCFNELLVVIPGLSDRLLTERLREFESEGLVQRTVIPGPPVRVSYELTKAGKGLKPVIAALSEWAERWVEI
ncbi:MAG TPA: helix-turn-helix domain-containing protein [Pyrinomonadaceae bacterium]|nr:helix-turn-helix domain-containing protein [Pyrinomonadaceae bacterium]